MIHPYNNFNKKMKIIIHKYTILVDNSKYITAMNKRTIIGLGLATVVLALLYFEYHNFLFACINIAVVYDTVYLFLQTGNKKIVSAFLVFMGCFNFYLFWMYDLEPLPVLLVITIAQVSDVYQYKIGTFITNKTTIGWISKNKSYEGYVGGLFLTFVTFIWFSSFWKIIMVYLLGIFGGLISSYIKRKVEIKDYSNLLGPHGGFVDRIDSIILPILLFRIIELF